MLRHLQVEQRIDLDTAPAGKETWTANSRKAEDPRRAKPPTALHEALDRVSREKTAAAFLRPSDTAAHFLRFMPRCISYLLHKPFVGELTNHFEKTAGHFEKTAGFGIFSCVVRCAL